MTVLSCAGLNVRIAGIRVVDDLDLDIRPGQFWGLLGPNGIGKTTLLRCLAGLVEPAAGRVLLQSRDVAVLPRKLLARHLGMLQQHTAYVFDSSVLQTVLTGRHPHLGYWEREGSADIEKARHALAAVDLAGFESRSVTELSGGEARRLAFATLLVQEPDVMLLDEPTNHLDPRHQLKIMRMVREHVPRDCLGEVLGQLPTPQRHTPLALHNFGRHLFRGGNVRVDRFVVGEEFHDRLDARILFRQVAELVLVADDVRVCEQPREFLEAVADRLQLVAYRLLHARQLTLLRGRTAPARPR